MTLEAPIYLDNHATTQCDPEVVESMLPFLTTDFGNPSSRHHAYGTSARNAVEHARRQVSRLLGCLPKEVVFTSGATESNNMALQGIAAAWAGTPGRLVTAGTEHKAVLDTCAHLESTGWEVVYLPVAESGLVDLDDLREALNHRTALCSIMWANNEVGTVQPIAEISAVCREAGVPFHCDAVQGLGWLPFDVQDIQADLVSLSGHKLHGPKGVGALYIRSGPPFLRLAPIVHGGGHERGYRSGTLATHQIVGLGAAAQLAHAFVRGDGPHNVRRRRDTLLELLGERVPDMVVNGTLEHRLPNNLNVAFPGVESEALLMNTPSVACSTGSACTSETVEPSHVLEALGVPEERLHSSIRLGLGRTTTDDEIARAADALGRGAAWLQDVSSARL